MDTTIKRTGKPIVAGILILLAAPVVLLQSFAAQAATGVMAWIVFWGFISFGIIAIVGGIFTLRRRVWGLALAGAICASLSFVSWMIGIPAVILVATSKNEFK